MIRSSRRRHLWLWLGLALLVPTLLALSLLRRPDEPLMDSLPSVLQERAVSTRGES